MGARPARLWIPLGGLACAWLLVIVIQVRYPGGAALRAALLGFGAFASILLFATGAFVVFLAGGQSPEHEADSKVGCAAGLVTGCLWIIEIGFNNFVDPKVSNYSARYFVDNGVWALIAFIILTTCCVRALRTKSFATAMRVGLWSGLVSGLMSCLMALLLVVVWMRFLVRDPISNQEYGARGAVEHWPGIAVYFAYEVMSGALAHLILLGLGMGALLGAIGGLVANLTVQLRSAR